MRVEGTIPEGCRVMVSCDGQEKTLDSLDKVIEFDNCGSGQEVLMIEEPPYPDKGTFISWLGFTLTIVIQGLLHILFLDTDWKWYKKVRAYRLKAKIMQCPSENTPIKIIVGTTLFNDRGYWEKPLLHVRPEGEIETEYIPDYQSIKNSFIDYIRKFVSCCFIVEGIFAVLIVITVLQSLLSGALISMVLLVASIVLEIWLITKEYKRYQCYLKQFKALI